MSDPLPVPAASDTFERIKRVNEAGAECWSSRDFARILGYTDYRNFEAVIEKARTACLNSGQRVEDHFVEITEMIGIGKGGQRPVKTVLVSRNGVGLNVRSEAMRGNFSAGLTTWGKRDVFKSRKELYPPIYPNRFSKVL